MEYYRVQNLFLILIATILYVGNVYSQQAARLPKQEQIHQIVRYYEEENGFNGNIIIAEEGKIIYENSTGWADIANERSLNLRTPFYIASVSKQFTAVSILILRDAGKLELDDYLIKYFPDLGNFAKKIKIRHLLNHTSGLPDYFQNAWDSPGFTNAQLYEKVKFDINQLNFRPGHKYRYNNTGYVLLSLIVEKVSGLPYYKFFESNISEPLGLENTWVFDLRTDPRPNFRALGYERNLKKENDYNLLTTGDGGVYSTIEDLFIWDQSLYSNKLINENSLEEAFTPITLTNGVNQNYGFGWFIGNNLNGKTVYHTGGLAGFRAYIERQIDVNNTIIILNNNEFDEVTEMRNILVKIMDERPYEFPGNE
jgi:CubicO group peptidase (beta-lactamase class C family)